MTTDVISAQDQAQSTTVAPAAKKWIDPLSGNEITKAELVKEAYDVTRTKTIEAAELEVKAATTKAQANWLIASKFGSQQDNDVYEAAKKGFQDAYLGPVIQAIEAENPTMRKEDIVKKAEKSFPSYAQRKSQFMLQLDACYDGGDGAVFFLQNMADKYVGLGSEDFMKLCRATRDSSINGKFDYLKYMDESGNLLTENGKLIVTKNGKQFLFDYEKPQAIAAPEGEESEPESTGNARTPEGEAPKGQLGKVQAWNDARMGDIERQLQGQSQTVQLKFLQKMCDVIIAEFPTANVEFEVNGMKLPMQARTVAHAMRKALQAQEAIVAPKAQTKTERQQELQKTTSPMIQDSIEADQKQPEPEITDTVEA